MEFIDACLKAGNKVFGDGICRQIQHEYHMIEMEQMNLYQQQQIDRRGNQIHEHRLEEMELQNRYQIEQSKLHAQQNREIQIIMQELRINLEQEIQRMHNSPFFYTDIDTASLLWQEFKESGKPLFLISPFWDETKINAIADAGGGDSQFRTVIGRTWREFQYNSFGICLDGIFNASSYP